MSHLLAPQIVILREGTDDHEGRGQIISNINACQAVVDVIKTTLGKYNYGQNKVGLDTGLVIEE